MFFSEASNRFLGHCQSATTLSGHTQRAYTSDLNDAKRYIGSRKHIATIHRDQLRGYLYALRDTRGLKETSIKRRLATLKLFFKWAQRESLIEKNPFDLLHEKIRLPKRLPKALDNLDARKLKKQLHPAQVTGNFDEYCLRSAISILITTGIRVSELCAINIDDYSSSDSYIKIHGKGNRQRLVYLLAPHLNRHLSNYLSKRRKLSIASERLFATEGRATLTPPLVRSALKQMAKNAGITKNVTPHMLRHTCATDWLESGLDIRYVQKLLGHHSISTTEIYTHVSDQGLRNALLRSSGGKKR